MKVFISWSGTASKNVALALRAWIPDVLQAAKPWISESDIWAGARWGREVERELNESRFGIICLTRANQAAPWVLFEAGALAKTLDDTYVCPYLFNLDPTDLAPGPLTQFQAKRADAEGTWDLVQTLNRCLGADALPEERLRRLFDRLWPDLQVALEGIPNDEADLGVRRSQEEMNAEILELVRGIARATSASQTLEAIEEVQKHLQMQGLANSAILSVVKKQSEYINQLVGGRESISIGVDLGPGTDGLVSVEVSPTNSVFDTLSIVWACLQEQQYSPPGVYLSLGLDYGASLR